MDKYNDLINRLSDKTLAEGHEVTIGRVLFIGEATICSCKDGFCKYCVERREELLKLWWFCGFSKSLNQILEEKPKGWEALFEFLIDLFPKQKTYE